MLENPHVVVRKDTQPLQPPLAKLVFGQHAGYRLTDDLDGENYQTGWVRIQV